MGLFAFAGGGKLDGGDQVDQLAQAVFVEAGAIELLGEHALEARVVALQGDHGVVDQLADRGLLGAGLQVGPAGFFGDPEDVLGAVFVRVFGVGAGVVAGFGLRAGEELLAVLFEGVGDVLEEDQAQDDVFVLRRVHVVAELVGGQPELGFETDVGGRLGAGDGGLLAGHGRGDGGARGRGGAWELGRGGEGGWAGGLVSEF